MTRVRNFARRAGESWTAYHDRLSGLAATARRAGASSTSSALQRAAGAVAKLHPEVKSARRKGKSSGPGTYSWEQCVSDAKRRGARDPKAVCGSIRAKSKKAYPGYWGARRNSPNEIAESIKRSRKSATLVAQLRKIVQTRGGERGEIATWQAAARELEHMGLVKQTGSIGSSSWSRSGAGRLREKSGRLGNFVATELGRQVFAKLESDNTPGVRNVKRNKRGTAFRMRPSDPGVLDYDRQALWKITPPITENWGRKIAPVHYIVTSRAWKDKTEYMAFAALRSGAYGRGAGRDMIELGGGPGYSSHEEMLKAMGYTPVGKSRNIGERPSCGTQLVGIGSGVPVAAAIPCRNKGARRNGVAMNAAERHALEQFCKKRSITYDVAEMRAWAKKDPNVGTMLSDGLEGIASLGLVTRSGSKWTITSSGRTELAKLKTCGPKRRAGAKSKRGKKSSKRRNVGERPSCGTQLVGIGSGVPVAAAIPCRNVGGRHSDWTLWQRQLEKDARFHEKRGEEQAAVFRYLILAMKSTSGPDALHLVHKADAFKETIHGRMWAAARGDLHYAIQNTRKLVMAKYTSRNKRSTRRR